VYHHLIAPASGGVANMNLAQKMRRKASLKQKCILIELEEFIHSTIMPCIIKDISRHAERGEFTTLFSIWSLEDHRNQGLPLLGSWDNTYQVAAEMILKNLKLDGFKIKVERKEYKHQFRIFHIYW
jgi:hypothetical protein